MKTLQFISNMISDTINKMDFEKVSVVAEPHTCNMEVGLDVHRESSHKPTSFVEEATLPYIELLIKRGLEDLKVTRVPLDFNGTMSYSIFLCNDFSKKEAREIMQIIADYTRKEYHIKEFGGVLEKIIPCKQQDVI